MCDVVDLELVCGDDIGDHDNFVSFEDVRLMLLVREQLHRNITIDFAKAV